MLQIYVLEFELHDSQETFSNWRLLVLGAICSFSVVWTGWRSELHLILSESAFSHVSVVWKEEVWYCWTNVLCPTSSYAGIWSSLLYDFEIPDKVFSSSSPSLPFPFPNTHTHKWWVVHLLKVCIECKIQVILLFFALSCSIHKGFCFREGVSSPISDLTERLLLDERDPPATPKESLYEAPPFDEVRWLNFLIKILIKKLELLVSSSCGVDHVVQCESLPYLHVYGYLLAIKSCYFLRLLFFVLNMSAGGHSSSCTCCRANKTGGNW